MRGRCMRHSVQAAMRCCVTYLPRAAVVGRTQTCNLRIVQATLPSCSHNRNSPRRQSWPSPRRRPRQSCRHRHHRGNRPCRSRRGSRHMRGSHPSRPSCSGPCRSLRRRRCQPWRPTRPWRRQRLWRKAGCAARRAAPRRRPRLPLPELLAGDCGGERYGSEGLACHSVGGGVQRHPVRPGFVTPGSRTTRRRDEHPWTCGRCVTHAEAP